MSDKTPRSTSQTSSSHVWLAEMVGRSEMSPEGRESLLADVAAFERYAYRHLAALEGIRRALRARVTADEEDDVVDEDVEDVEDDDIEDVEEGEDEDLEDVEEEDEDLEDVEEDEEEEEEIEVVAEDEEDEEVEAAALLRKARKRLKRTIGNHLAAVRSDKPLIVRLATTHGDPTKRADAAGLARDLAAEEKDLKGLQSKVATMSRKKVREKQQAIDDRRARNKKRADKYLRPNQPALAAH